MNAIPVMLNGLPGNVAVIVAEHILSDARLRLIPFSLTGPEIEQPDHTVGDLTVRLIRPDTRETEISTIKAANPDFISIDYTHPSAVLGNAEF